MVPPPAMTTFGWITPAGRPPPKQFDAGNAINTELETPPRKSAVVR